MKNRRVVVTGMGALTPIGNTIKEFWKNLVDGKSGADKITLFDAAKFKTRFACEVKGFQAEDYLDRKEARRLDRFCQLALAVADQALTDSKLLSSSFNNERTGVIWGSGIGGLTTMLQETKSFLNNGESPRLNPFFIPKIISDIPAGHISIKYGLKGPNYSAVSACASASNAIINAFNYIKLGFSDAFVTGGSEACVNELGIGGFNAMMALSTRNDDPKTASRPFDSGRDGFVLGEGAGALVIEELEHAKKRGAKIYAEIVGVGLSADAHHITAPHPEGEGARKVMRDAVNYAGLDLSEIDYINVHGTSTPLGDVAELKAVESLFGIHSQKINISSTKSMTGHLLGAAGAVESIATILSIKNSVVTPTINNFNLDPAINNNLQLTLNIAQERDIKTALCNTFGFGGHNASIMFSKI
ncbi:MAG: beta-ketoacyl-[acyl-carrier-protein] synthase II [Flavobacteriales bacterium TMED84]|nr:MAG: beta-ketoacyl-[acyl-carrier-protein] synthase II [Flavobacteriales bacterium TMED84]RPG53879.1 MAG: beta-ketoacyl-[acyl-carrier-protein] synthase II [Flavobacteriales bacterium TMED84]|tara:strand:+ start:9911 stop:11158 length:1248 start_codon:yes stop_codon:yes gene_type:complete